MSGPSAAGGAPELVARYDGHAQWYDDWARSAGGATTDQAKAALNELVPAPGSGLAVDIGCGTGLHAAAVRDRGYRLLGVDVSADQLRLARRRLTVVRADANTLPLRNGCARLAYSVLTHTDVEDFRTLIAEGIRVLAPGGVFIYVGVHPAFVHPFVEPLSDRLLLHPGYRNCGWQPSTPFTGTAVRRRVGVHHLPLEQLLSALIDPRAPLDRIIERGGESFPLLLAARLTRLG